MNVKALIKSAGNVIEKNSPHILTALGAVGVMSTAVMTGKATAKACTLIGNEEFERGHIFDPKEKIQVCWRLYIPPVIMGGVSIACIIGANSVNTKRNAALAGLYSVAETTLKEYQEKVVEHIGKNKEQAIHDEIIQDHLDKNPVSKADIIITNKGKTLCFDEYSGRYFYGDIETIRKIVNDLNHDLMGEMWVPLNELYYQLGLESIKLGDEIGWTTDELIDMHYTSKLADDGTPCLVIEYNAQPKHIRFW